MLDAPLEQVRDYRMRIITDLADIAPTAWDALIVGEGDGLGDTQHRNPFLRHAFLHALQDTGCATAETGWQPETLTLWSGNQLRAAAPLYRKTHSYGEYIFDWAWADAYQRHGLVYYPKLVNAIPFTPVTGPRLLARTTDDRAALARAMMQHATESGVSSLHSLFLREEDAQLLAKRGGLLRDSVQFHWTNSGYADFDEFLNTLERKKRKNIRAERRKVADAGVTLRRIRGAEISAADWGFFTRCYNHTYHAHHSSPYLNLEFFQRIGAAMSENLLLVIAERSGRPIASALLVYSPDTLYGRYWGEIEHVPCLHFECAYYQPLEFCIEEGIGCFEGGAQGEHKMARGFLPVRTRSAHWVAHSAFAEAIGEFLGRESAGIGQYIDELHEHLPFRR